MQADTKTALLDLAERAVRSRGYDGFSYADLARAQGIRKASIHYHFPTKADLSQNLMARYHTRFEKQLLRINAHHDRPEDRLDALVKLYRDALNNGQTLCLCVAFSGSHDSLAQPVRAQIRAFRQMVVDWIAANLPSTCDDQGSQAQGILAQLEGAHLAARMSEDVSLFDAATATLVARVRS
ncbi:MAG: TetR/AcrR family transcriptional regulator [Litoreibacter sp.]|nr:TetR/AcrR family transcriptional regulator [Litoreibacter sp.]